MALIAFNYSVGTEVDSTEIVAKYNATIKPVIVESFNYDSDLESQRNWISGTGAYEVQTATINGSIDSVFTCTSAGTISLQSSTAYGTYEFDVLKGTNTRWRLYFVSSTKDLQETYRPPY